MSISFIKEKKSPVAEMDEPETKTPTEEIADYNREKIEKAQTMGELITVLSAVDEIEGSQKKYSSVELVEQIQKIFQLVNSNPAKAVRYIRGVTRSMGLRDKLVELLSSDLEDAVRDQVKTAVSFDELYSIIKNLRTVRGSQKKYKAQGLIFLIDALRRGKRVRVGDEVIKITPKHIPRAHGLRNKVKELLELEK